MVNRDLLKQRIVSHLDGHITLEDLAAWAEEVFRNEEFDPPHADEIAEVLASIRDAVDPHRFRWEEPDFEDILEKLEELK
jgi:hypothetical protein